MFIFAVFSTAYVVLFLSISKLSGHGTATAGILFVLAAGLCWGYKAGFLAGAMAFPVNMLMMGLVGLDWKPGMLSGGGITGHIAFMIIGLVTGYMRDLYIERKQINRQLQHEIARRGRDMEMLRLAEMRQQTIIQESVDAILIIAGKMISSITMANRAFLELVGLSADQVIGKSVFDFMPVAQQTYQTVLGSAFSIDDQIYNDMHAKMVALLERGRVSNWDFFLLDSRGQVVLLEANAAFFHAGQQDSEGAVFIFRDISHRKRIERKLEEANKLLQLEIKERATTIEILENTRKRLETIIEQSGDGILISDSMTMSVSMCNKAFCELVGYERPELIGQSIFDLLPVIGQQYKSALGGEITIDESFYEKSRPAMGMLQESGTIQNWELFFANRDRVLVPVEINTSYMYNEQQEMVAAVSVIRNITAHKLIEQQLNSANDFLGNIIENSLDGIIISDETGHITSVNKASLDIMGYDQQDLLGLTPVAFAFFDEGLYETTVGEQVWVTRQYLLECMARMEIFFDEGKIHNYRYYIKRGDGYLVEVESTIAMLHSQAGEPVGSVSIMRDITQRRRMERELLRQHDQLVAANGELESFAYSVSHDLRAPLRSISGFSAAVEEDFGGLLPDEGRRYLERIRSAAGRMGSLIDDMLKLSRVIRQEMRRERVDLSALGCEIAAQLQEQEPGREASFTITPGLVALGDGNLLRIVLENLFGNAWKYTCRESRAMISFGCADSDCQDLPEHALAMSVFQITDNGVGFDMAYADKLFGPFQRLHSDPGFSGSGIGLATVQRIVQRHGGRVWGRSAPGEGATFFFTLP